MHAALRRLWAQLGAEAVERQRRREWPERLVDGRPPAWVGAPTFGVAVEACDAALRGEHAVQRAMELVRSLRRLREHVDALRLETPVGPEPPQPMRAPEGMSAHRAAALVRLCYGEALEAYAALAARRICPTTEVPCCGAQQREMARLSFDSYCAAMWTSAHAEYIAALDDLESEDAGFGDTTPAEAVEVAPPPELGLLTAAANAPDLIALYERAHAPRACAKPAQTMLALLMRATNAGSRGWESALATAVKDSEGVARVLAHATAAAFTGLHPCVHPAARPGWAQRLVSARACRLGSSTTEVRGLAAASPGPMKEVMRLYLALLLAEDPATLDALGAAQQPSGQLSIPPRSTTPTALQAAMHAFLAAGETLLAAPSLAERPLAERVNAHLTAEPRTRKKAAARPPARAAHGATVALAYCASWLGGRGSHASAASAAGAAPDDADADDGSFAPTAVSTASSVLASAFRGAFLPLWIHAHWHGHRVSRLDEPQYRAMHGRSPAHELLARLDEATTLRAQRAALATPDAPLLTLARACAVLGIRPPPPPEGAPAPSASGGGARAANEAEATLLRLPAKEAAAVFVFARTSALRSQALAYDLGPRTRGLQLAALSRRLRLGLGDAPDAPDAPPAHATHLYCCTECRRIVNACQDGSGKDATFNEIGLSASMLRVGDEGFDGAHMRCAKRSSAALRTAVSLEESARALEIEARPPPDAGAPLPNDLRPATVAELPARPGCAHTSDIAKMRRDIKNCTDQLPRATACGDVPLVRIPVLGRAIRVFGDWYALCALCGALARIHPDARFGAEPCCMRCDYAMLHGKQEERAIAAAIPRPAPVRCRFCGRAEVATTGTKFKVVFAPADATARNAGVPPPLRTCAYCPQHYRPWLHTAQREIATNVILSHVALRARPIIGAETGKRTVDEAEREEQRLAAVAAGGPTARSRSRGAASRLGALKRRARNNNAAALARGPRAKAAKG